MDWLGSPAFQFATVVFGVLVSGIGGYGFYRGRISRSELAFMLVGVAAMLAYGIDGTVTVLSLPRFVADLFAGLAGLAFLGLFLYWASSSDSEASE